MSNTPEENISTTEKRGIAIIAENSDRVNSGSKDKMEDYILFFAAGFAELSLRMLIDLMLKRIDNITDKDFQKMYMALMICFVFRISGGKVNYDQNYLLLKLEHDLGYTLSDCLFLFEEEKKWLHIQTVIMTSNHPPSPSSPISYPAVNQILRFGHMPLDVGIAMNIMKVLKVVYNDVENKIIK